MLLPRLGPRHAAPRRSLRRQEVQSKDKCYPELVLTAHAHCVQVYNVGAHEPSPSCDHLNFAKHVFQPGSYRLAGDMVAWCGHQQEEVLSHGSYDQTGMKLARR